MTSFLTTHVYNTLQFYLIWGRPEFRFCLAAACSVMVTQWLTSLNSCWTHCVERHADVSPTQKHPNVEEYVKYVRSVDATDKEALNL